jgi:hypothetical protein
VVSGEGLDEALVGVETIIDAATVSIIGIDKFHSGYNAAKVVQEQTLLEGPLPVRIVRAAQFHEFVDPLVGWTIQDGVAHVPEMRLADVAAGGRRCGSTHLTSGGMSDETSAGLSDAKLAARKGP